MSRRPLKKKSSAGYVTALAADEKGNIFDLPGFAACGMAGSTPFLLSGEKCIRPPRGSELMYLPGRAPVVWDIAARRFVTLWENPFPPGGPLYPVAVFNSPAYLVLLHASYEEGPDAPWLPLFSYGACGMSGDSLISAAVRIDESDRQELRLMPVKKVEQGVALARMALPDNRLARHLETCALTYGCPAGKNFFVGREEAPLPTSVTCNARCLGCLSLQPETGIPASQNRISFTPNPEEISATALFHLGRVPGGVVSFGQGCEGEPLLAARVIAPAVERIRASTLDGTVNVNTNGSRPEALAEIFDRGADSVRVSLNSARQPLYEAYFRPSYEFSDVLRSLDEAGQRGKWISLNYLNLAGFTDTEAEFAALCDLLSRYPVSMIQWRNLNFDPLRYHAAMAKVEPAGPALGMDVLTARIRKLFPKLRFGYFNPPLR
ncbi:MAG: radical SAM protein [Thermodesulfobacteriota bacterium]